MFSMSLVARRSLALFFFSFYGEDLGLVRDMSAPNDSSVRVLAKMTMRLTIGRTRGEVPCPIVMNLLLSIWHNLKYHNKESIILFRFMDIFPANEIVITIARLLGCLATWALL